MSGVFLSYSRADRAIAEHIVSGLRACDVVVWWDEDMRGVDWQDELERRINELACVVVLWTAHSAGSGNVKDEARLALETGKLVNVLHGAPKPPFPYDRVNGLPLDGWNPREPHNGWNRLVQTIDDKVAAAGGTSGEIVAALSHREKEIRAKKQAVERANDAFQRAQLNESAAGEAAGEAAATFHATEVQHQQVVQMRAAVGIQRAAQQELDAAQSALAAAGQVQRSARAALSEASLALTRAEAALDRLFPVNATPERPEPAVPARQEGLSPAPPSPTRPTRWPWAAAAAVALVALGLGGGAMLFGRRGDVRAASAKASPQNIPAVSPPQAVIPARLNGEWTLPNVACADAISISANGDELSVGGTPSKIIGVDADGVVETSPTDGGFSYAVTGDALVVTSPSGEATRYTRCAS